jgi:hypothetical protein
MTDEIYHKDLFGAVVDVNLSEIEEDEGLVGPASRPDFNVFVLTDAIGARDKRRAWTLYMQALSAGLVAEELFFKIVWQVKCMLIASKTKSVAETDMKPYPYSKAKGFLKNWKEGELEKLSEDLVIGYQRTRRGEGEMEMFVEKTLLSL